MMNFQTFQYNCKHAQYGLKQDTVREFELTCRNPKCVPKGTSWGVCNESHCPYFGMKVGSGKMVDANTGETLLTFNGCKLIFGN